MDNEDQNDNNAYIQHEAKKFLGDIVSKNNQNSMLLDRVFKAEIQDNTEGIHSHKMIGLQGESRIFFFDCGRDGEITDEEQENRKEKCRNLLLKLYVAPLTRILKIGSTFFSVLDNATYACILLLFFGSSILSPEDFSNIHNITRNDNDNIFDNETGINTATVVTLGSDLLHNIMHASTRLWNLSRVDLQLVLVIYAAYFIILSVGKVHWVYWYVLSFRFFAFYVTESCDYWIDMLVQVILKTLKEGENATDVELQQGFADFKLHCSGCCCGFVENLVGLLGFPYSRLNRDDIEALRFYKGAFCSWDWRKSSLSFVKTYHGDDSVQELPSCCSIHWFFYLGGIIAFMAVFLLSCVVFFFGGIAFGLGFCLVWIFKLCCISCDWGIHEELYLW